MQDNEGMQRARVYVSGGVQGVSFRDATRREAERLGLSGWVSNLPDGRVEAVFEGQPDAVREAVRWCEQGPPGASVEEVETSHEEPQGGPGGFEVR